MSRIPTFVTERLVLRPPSPGDLADFVALGLDSDVMRYIGQGKPQSSIQAGFSLECMLAEARHGFPTPGAPQDLPGWLVAIERNSQSFIGLAALVMLPAVHVTAVGSDLCVAPCVEVGYRLARPFWGKGYATEAGSALVRFGFENIGLQQIVGIADVRNTASNRVLDKLGLATHKTYELGGTIINFHCASREEWLGSESSA